MNLFEYDLEIEKCIDEETGEILDERLDQLVMERDRKIENIAMWVKELDAEADAIKREKQKLAERQQTAENKSERLQRYLSRYLDGCKFKTARVAISYRRSEALVIDDETKIPTEYLKMQRPLPDKVAIKDAMKKGTASFDGIAHLEEKQNIQIK